MAFDFVSFYQNIILNKIVTAIIIFFVGFMLAKIAENLTKRFLEEVELNKRMIKTFFGNFNLEKIGGVIVSYIIYIATIVMVLNKLELTSYVFYGLIIMIALVIILTLILDMRDLIPNIYAFAKIKRKKYFVENDRVKTHLAEGVVKKITPLTTRIITDHGDELYIQNYAIIENLSVEKKTSI